MSTSDEESSTRDKASELVQHIYAKMPTVHTLIELLVVILGAGVIFLCLSKTMISSAFYDSYDRALLLKGITEEQGDLLRVLKGASMKNRTVILTTANEAWMAPNATFELMLESFRIGDNISWLVKHLVVVVLDQNAYSRCRELHLHCYLLTTPNKNFSEAANFMTPNYLDMMWVRINFLHTVLQLGYNFVFTDVDIVWLRNPFHHFFEGADFQIACDDFNGNSSDVNNFINGGFNYVLSNNRTAQFYQYWNQSRERYPGMHDQDVFNNIKHDPFVKEIGIKMRFLNTLYFGGFCQPSKDINQVCTMHANCCSGLETKAHDLDLVLQDWKEYRARPSEHNTSETAQLSIWREHRRC